jgi:hypothetical protein
MAPYAQGQDVSWSDMPEGMGFYAQGTDVPISQMPAGMGFGTAGGIDLSNLNRFAGTLGGLFGPGLDIKDTAKELNQLAKRERERIGTTISKIYPKLTGLTGEEALNKYYENFSDVIKNTQELGRADLGIDPELADQYDRLGSRVQNIQNQYSLGGRLGGYERLALEPPVVSTNVGSIRRAADLSAPDIARQYAAFTNYSGPQASNFIYGSKRTADDIGDYYSTSENVAKSMDYKDLDEISRYYANSGDVAKLLDYKTRDAVGRYYNTSGDVAGLMNYGTLA